MHLALLEQGGHYLVCKLVSGILINLYTVFVYLLKISYLKCLSFPSLLCYFSSIDWGSVHVPSTSATRLQQHSRQRIDQDNPETIRLMFLSDPHQMSLLKERNPRLAEVINNASDFKKVLENSIMILYVLRAGNKDLS